MRGRWRGAWIDVDVGGGAGWEWHVGARRKPRGGRFERGTSGRERRPVQMSAASRRGAQAARAAAVSDYGIPTVEEWKAGLDVALLKEIAGELEHWSGSETTVHLPVRIRPEMAELVAGLLDGMVDGSEAASLMMQCLPEARSARCHQAEADDADAPRPASAV